MSSSQVPTILTKQFKINSRGGEPETSSPTGSDVTNLSAVPNNPTAQHNGNQSDAKTHIEQCFMVRTLEGAQPKLPVSFNVNQNDSLILETLSQQEDRPIPLHSNRGHKSSDVGIEKHQISYPIEGRPMSTKIMAIAHLQVHIETGGISPLKLKRQ